VNYSVKVEPNLRPSSPFGAEAIEEVPLHDAPLIRVLAQVKVNRLSSLASGEDAARQIAFRLRERFPYFAEDREYGLSISPQGVGHTLEGQRVWRLRSTTSTVVTFGESFLAVETSDYTSRSAFVGELVAAWNAFSAVVEPGPSERVGVRYTNMLPIPKGVSTVRDLVRAESLGGYAEPTAEARLMFSLTESHYSLPDHRGLLVRSGFVPKGATVDPSLPPVETPSWVLDLDAFRMDERLLGAQSLEQEAGSLAEQAYRYFRWVVTPTFLARHAGAAG